MFLKYTLPLYILLIVLFLLLTGCASLDTRGMAVRSPSVVTVNGAPCVIVPNYDTGEVLAVTCVEKDKE